MLFTTALLKTKDGNKIIIIQLKHKRFFHITEIKEKIFAQKMFTNFNFKTFKSKKGDAKKMGF